MRLSPMLMIVLLASPACAPDGPTADGLDPALTDPDEDVAVPTTPAPGGKAAGTTPCFLGPAEHKLGAWIENGPPEP